MSPAGDILSRLSADTTQMSDLISQNTKIFLRDVVKGTGDFVFMCAMSWKLALMTVTGFPFIAVLSKIYGDYYKVSPSPSPSPSPTPHPPSPQRWEEAFPHPFSLDLQKLSKEVQTTLAEANKVAEETISSMRTVRSFANERGEAESFTSKLLLMFQLNKKQALAYGVYVGGSSVSARPSLPGPPALLHQRSSSASPGLRTGPGGFCGLLRRPPRHLQADEQRGADRVLHLRAGAGRVSGGV